MENSELENPEFNQSTSEKISEVFISEFSVLGIVQNGNLGGENPRKTVSEISENSEFLTSPYLLINRKLKLITQCSPFWGESKVEQFTVEKWGNKLRFIASNPRPPKFQNSPYFFSSKEVFCRITQTMADQIKM